jgi:hypothetical protein
MSDGWSRTVRLAMLQDRSFNIPDIVCGKAVHCCTLVHRVLTSVIFGSLSKVKFLSCTCEFYDYVPGVLLNTQLDLETKWSAKTYIFYRHYKIRR